MIVITYRMLKYIIMKYISYLQCTSNLETVLWLVCFSYHLCYCRVVDVLEGKGGYSKGRFQGKVNKLQNRNKAAQLIKDHMASLTNESWSYLYSFLVFSYNSSDCSLFSFFYPHDYLEVSLELTQSQLHILFILWRDFHEMHISVYL